MGHGSDPRHHHRLAGGARRSLPRAAPMVADAVHGIRATGGRPRLDTQRHHHRPYHSDSPHHQTGVDEYAGLVQIPACARPAGGDGRRLAPSRLDNLPVGGAANRHLRRHQGRTVHHNRRHPYLGEYGGLRAARLPDRIPPHRRGHRDSHYAGGMDQLAMESAGAEPVVEQHRHRADFGVARGRWMRGCRTAPHHPARPLRTAAEPLPVHEPAQRHALIRQEPQG